MPERRAASRGGVPDDMQSHVHPLSKMSWKSLTSGWGIGKAARIPKIEEMFIHDRRRREVPRQLRITGQRYIRWTFLQYYGDPSLAELDDTGAPWVPRLGGRAPLSTELVRGGHPAERRVGRVAGLDLRQRAGMGYGQGKPETRHGLILASVLAGGRLHAFYTP